MCCFSFASSGDRRVKWKLRTDLSIWQFLCSKVPWFWWGDYTWRVSSQMPFPKFHLAPAYGSQPRRAHVACMLVSWVSMPLGYYFSLSLCGGGRDMNAAFFSYNSSCLNFTLV
jgi:hypothetical protein